MQECKLYETNKAELEEFLHYNKNITETSQPEKYNTCSVFCKHYKESNGFPGETLCYCEHPLKKDRFLHAYSVFDNVTHQKERLKILDEIC